MRYELHIPECAPSPNKAMRLHWAARKKLWDKWGWLIAAAKKGRPKRPLERARVTVVRYAVRALDPDNLIGAQKPLIDGLVRNGYLVDDSAQHVELIVRQEKSLRGAIPCTLIEIESLAG